MNPKTKKHELNYSKFTIILKCLKNIKEKIITARKKIHYTYIYIYMHIYIYIDR